MHKFYDHFSRSISNPTPGGGDGGDAAELKSMTEKYSLVVKENSALTLALCACQVGFLLLPLALSFPLFVLSSP